VVLDNLSHLIWPICERCNASNKLTSSARHFFSIGQISRTRYISSIDGISDNNIQSLFGRCRAKAHCVARIEKTLCTSHGQESVFFNSQGSQLIEIAAVPGEMCMSVSQTRHQCAAFAVEDPDTKFFLKLFDSWYLPNCYESLPF
jgi:hypothetical protein